MIRGFVEYALKNRFIIMTVTVLLLIWGAISFRNLPVEAYPDVANNYVQVITQWPGRAAEEVEQQVTIPIALRPFQRDVDLRRRIAKRREPPASAGATFASQPPE
jgi:Cu/Ag efflux pump CusA